MHCQAPSEVRGRLSSSLFKGALVFFLVIALLIPARALPVEGGKNDYGIFRAASPSRFIPLTSPRYISISEATVGDDQRVIGLAVGSDVRCFPIRQMWYHHVVNDEIGGEKLAVTYCIMANTAETYRLDDLRSGLRVAGLFGGVLALGREGSDEVWPQIACSLPVPDNPTSGPLTRGPRPLITTFRRWKTLHPDTKVLAPDEKFEFYYDAFDQRPRGYNANPAMNETVANRDARLEPGVEVYGLSLNGKSIAFPLDTIKDRKTVEGELAGQKFKIQWDDRLETPSIVEPFPGVALRAYWYAWADFYPQSEIGGAAHGEKP